MDIDEAGWILEFLLQQNSLDDRTLNDLIRVLPLPNNNSRLKKRLILRKIESDIEKGKISERTIDFLEQIEELDLREGNTDVSEAMKGAYCTVAMHYTAKLIEESTGDKKDKYASAVKRIFSRRIREMERCDVKLVQDDLVRWVRDIESGVLDVNVCENVLEMFKELDVFGVVRRYINEAKENMGPSFLELACETILSDDALSRAMGLDEVAKLNNQSKDITPNDDATANNKEALRDHVLPTHKHVAQTHRGAKIVDPMETSHDKYDYIPTPEVNKVQKALETSSFELHAVVKDPLPDALRLAESLKVNTSVENVAHGPVVSDLTMADDEAPGLAHDRKGKALETDGDDDISKDQNRRIKPNLFERNNTAHTIEWSDSIDSSEKGSPTRPHLPSPRKRDVSPLSIYKCEKLTRQRKKKRWTTLEEDTLRTGVQKYGKGNWKLILSMYRDIFEDRTEVDLKDKWRNLTRW